MLYKFEVSTGQFKIKIKAINHTMAAMKALETIQGGYLGVLTKIRKDGDQEKDDLYASTEGLLKKMGINISE